MIDDYMDDSLARELETMRQGALDYPKRVAESVLNRISKDTPFGMAIRQTHGKTLEQYLRQAPLQDMHLLAERLVRADRAFGTALGHTPDFTALSRIVDAAAELSEGNESKFAKTLSDVVPMIPGLDSQNNPMSMHSFYEKHEVPEGSDSYDVLEQVAEALDDPNLSQEDRSYWMKLAYQANPDLRSLPPESITGRDVPMSDRQLGAIEGEKSYNSILGRGSDQFMRSIYGSASPQPEEATHSDSGDGDVAA